MGLSFLLTLDALMGLDAIDEAEKRGDVIAGYEWRVFSRDYPDKVALRAELDAMPMPEEVAF